jgi:osmotically-inducible protein OsmY
MKTTVDLEKAVQDSLHGNPGMAKSHIGVTVKDGVAWLRGTVPSTAEQWEAERLAALVEGITRVVNHLEVVPEQKASAF